MSINGSRAFRSAIAHFKGFVIIDFWASWCVPCQVMTPILEQLVREYPDQVKVFKVNIDGTANQKLVAKHKIRAVPTFLIYKNGRIVDRVTALMAKKAFVERLGLAK